eukprot:Pgem_evm1s12152
MYKNFVNDFNLDKDEPILWNENETETEAIFHEFANTGVFKNDIKKTIMLLGEEVVEKLVFLETKCNQAVTKSPYLFYNILKGEKHQEPNQKNLKKSKRPPNGYCYST